jgi:hypothetical protein
MINPQMPPRDRIKRPDMPQFEPEPEQIDDNSEGLSQDDLNEWLTQKIIRFELEIFRKEAREGRTPLQQRQSVQRIEPERFKDKPKPKQQPYESMYGKTEDEVTPVKPKGKSKTKTIVMFIFIIAIAGLLAWVGLQLMGWTVSGG